MRGQIDVIDDQLVELFKKRMNVAAEIAAYKREHNLPILVPARELEKLQDVAQKAGPEMAAYTRVLYCLLFELSRSYQGRQNPSTSALRTQIMQAIRSTPEFFSESVPVACMGCPTICEKIFNSPVVTSFQSEAEVFDALNQGLCQYGILEKTAANYAQLAKRGFYIVRSFRLRPNRLICVGKNPEFHPDSGKTSVMMTLSNEPGTLYKILARMYTLGINVSHVESSSESAICFDFDTPSNWLDIPDIMCELEELCKDFYYLGSYSEAIL